MEWLDIGIYGMILWIIESVRVHMQALGARRSFGDYEDFFKREKARHPVTQEAHDMEEKVQTNHNYDNYAVRVANCRRSDSCGQLCIPGLHSLTWLQVFLLGASMVLINREPAFTRRSHELSRCRILGETSLSLFHVVEIHQSHFFEVCSDVPNIHQGLMSERQFGFQAVIIGLGDGVCDVTEAPSVLCVLLRNKIEIWDDRFCHIAGDCRRGIDQ
jgi:hypothetical protein